MPRSSRATLRSQWWKNYFGSIKYCYACSGKLKRQYVKEEKKWRHVCQKCKTITYLNPRVVAAVIPLTKDGKVALLRRGIEPGYGKWSYPAGFQELGETTEEAAIRETMEEIEVKVKIEKTIGLYSYADAGVVTIVYQGRIVGKKEPSPGEESLETALFRKKDIPWKKLAFRSTVHALKDWASNRRRI